MIVILVYSFLMFCMMWVESMMMMFLLIFESRLQNWLCFLGFSLVVGLFIMISWGLLMRYCVMLKCCCILLEQLFMAFLWCLYRFIWWSRVLISFLCLFLFCMFFSMVMWLSMAVVEILGYILNFCGRQFRIWWVVCLFLRMFKLFRCILFLFVFCRVVMMCIRVDLLVLFGLRSLNMFLGMEKFMFFRV